MKVFVVVLFYEKVIEVLKNVGFEVVYEEYFDEDRFVEFVKDVDVIIVRSKLKVIRKVIEVVFKFKVIGRVGVGFDNIDFKVVEERGIKVVNSFGVSFRSVVELVIGFIFVVVRKIVFVDRKMREGVWVKK